MKSIYEFELKGIHNEDLPLARFSGKVAMIVNVASQCGLTPQYKALEALYQKYKEQGFVVIGIPCNQFGGQEPWSETQIYEYCTTEYLVSFPMSSKHEVNGENRHLLYERLTCKEAEFPGDIGWNFEKFLINRQGEVIKRFEPSLEPSARAVIKAIESAL